MSAFPEKTVTKVNGSTLLALRKGGWGSNFQGEKRYVTPEWSLSSLLVPSSVPMISMFYLSLLDL